MLAEISLLDLLNMIHEDVQPSEVFINKNKYRWISVKKDYYNIATGYSLMAEVQQVIPLETSAIVSKKILNYDRELLTPEEKEYLIAVLSPYKDKIEGIKKIPITQDEKSDTRLVITFSDEDINMTMPKIPYDDDKYCNLRVGQKYTADELKLWENQPTS